MALDTEVQVQTTISPLEAARTAQTVKVMALLAEGSTQKAALEQVGMTRRQFLYWMRKEGGTVALSNLVQEKAVDALLRVIEGYDKAIDNLVLIANGDHVRAQDRLAAIKEMRLMLGEALGPANRHAGDMPDDGEPENPDPVPFNPNFGKDSSPGSPAENL